MENNMKKLIIFLILVMFFTVSCSTSKKAGNNDSDILPDEDEISGEEAVELDEDEIENDEDNGDTETDDGDPCSRIANSDGGYTQISDEKFKCSCPEGYFWANPGCKKTTYANICTGQTECYDDEKEIECPKEGEDFYGQDAQYAKLGYCTKSSFSIDKSVKNEETVKDNNLHIEWMRKPAEDFYRWVDAVDYCRKLNFAGHKDWRLPEPKEMLFSVLSTEILDKEKSLWSGKYLASNSSNAWGMLKDGDDFLLSVWQKTGSYYVRCVRGETPAKPLFKTFELNGGKIVRDMESGLAWTASPEPVSSWKEALAYCENLDYAGFSDWRVPNMHEIISLADYGKSNPATSFPNAKKVFAGDPVSSTTQLNDGDGTMFKYIDFDYYNGRNRSEEKSKEYNFDFYAHCVRNEPCIENYWWNGVECLKDPCIGDPCGKDEHSTGNCYTTDFRKHECECDTNYFWDGVKCVSPCEENPCKSDKLSDKVCTALDTERYSCGCQKESFWDGEKCVN